MSRAAWMLITLLALGGGGCGLDPFEPETKPPVADLQVRITEGIGATRRYSSATELQPPSTIQLRSLIGDGDAVEYSISRGPARELSLVAMEADTSEPLASVSISAANGERLAPKRLFSFDPGFVAIEDNSDAERLLLRATASRRLDIAQGQVPFSFKINVARGGGADAGSALP